MMHIPLLGSGVTVFFKHSEYTVRESAGRVAITIQAIRGYHYYHASFYVKIRASVSRNLKGNWKKGIHVIINITMSCDYILLIEQ